MLPNLTDTVQHWRLVPSGDGKRSTMTMINPGLQCLVLPSGSYASTPHWAEDANRMVLLPAYEDVRMDDEFRFGRRPGRLDRPVDVRKLTVMGVALFDGFGGQHLEAWCREVIGQ
jgi:hypothetical protein